MADTALDYNKRHDANNCQCRYKHLQSPNRLIPAGPLDQFHEEDRASQGQCELQQAKEDVEGLALGVVDVTLHLI